MTRDEALLWGRGVRARVATRDVPAEVLALVDERAGGRFCGACRVLGLVTPDDVPLEVDHRQALNRGGDHHHLNLEWLCRSHNRSKKDKPAGSRLRRPRWERRKPAG